MVELTYSVPPSLHGLDHCLPCVGSCSMHRPVLLYASARNGMHCRTIIHIVAGATSCSPQTRWPATRCASRDEGSQLILLPPLRQPCSTTAVLYIEGCRNVALDWSLRGHYSSRVPARSIK